MKIAVKKNLLKEIDVSLADLRDLERKPDLKSVIDFLDDFWVGKFRERETSVKIGDIVVSLNENSQMEIKFVTRFSLEDHSELVNQLKERLS